MYGELISGLVAQPVRALPSDVCRVELQSQNNALSTPAIIKLSRLGKLKY